ncbi:MAG: dihydroorotate dehydrogenase-like protein [Bacteroidota bacterium]
MANLTIQYMGLQLKNPIIVAANNLVVDLNNLKKMEEAGAAAIVYKSLFEEQIQLENLEMHETMAEFEERNAEMTSLFPDMTHAGPEEFLMNLRKAKLAVSIPVIASLNAVYQETWVEYAKKIEETGVDAIELNFYAVPTKFDLCGKTIEDTQVEILKTVKAALKIPVSVKLSFFYSNPLRFITKMDEAGADGVVIFNRFFQHDIDINTESQVFNYSVSNAEDNRIPMRFAGLLYGNLKASICANTGIFDGSDVIKMLLAGADCVQIASTIYKNQISHIAKMLSDMEAWMTEKKYASINDFKGKLSKKNLKDTFAYKRAQYIDILMKSNDIFKKYPTI